MTEDARTRPQEMPDWLAELRQKQNAYKERKLAKGEKLEEDVKIAPPKPAPAPASATEETLEIEPIERDGAGYSNPSDGIPSPSSSPNEKPLKGAPPPPPPPSGADFAKSSSPSKKSFVPPSEPTASEPEKRVIRSVQLKPVAGADAPWLKELASRRKTTNALVKKRTKNDGIINLTGERTKTYQQRSAELDEKEAELRRIAENTHKLEKLGNLADLITHLNNHGNGLRKLERVDNMLNKARDLNAAVQEAKKRAEEEREKARKAAEEQEKKEEEERMAKAIEKARLPRFVTLTVENITAIPPTEEDMARVEKRIERITAKQEEVERKESIRKQRLERRSIRRSTKQRLQEEERIRREQKEREADERRLMEIEETTQRRAEERRKLEEEERAKEDLASYVRRLTTITRLQEKDKQELAEKLETERKEREQREAEKRSAEEQLDKERREKEQKEKEKKEIEERLAAERKMREQREQEKRDMEEQLWQRQRLARERLDKEVRRSAARPPVLLDVLRPMDSTLSLASEEETSVSLAPSAEEARAEKRTLMEREEQSRKETEGKEKDVSEKRENEPAAPKAQGMERRTSDVLPPMAKGKGRMPLGVKLELVAEPQRKPLPKLPSTSRASISTTRTKPLPPKPIKLNRKSLEPRIDKQPSVRAGGHRDQLSKPLPECPHSKKSSSSSKENQHTTGTLRQRPEKPLPDVPSAKKQSSTAQAPPQEQARQRSRPLLAGHRSATRVTRAAAIAMLG